MRTALRTILLAIREAWNPTTALFANGEVGVFYDCSDLTTMYQDSAGTTPVTAVEQPVGLILDKSKGLVLGPELVSLLSGWGAQSGATIAYTASELVVTANGTAFAGAAVNIDCVVGRTYKIKISASTSSLAPWQFAVSGKSSTVINILANSSVSNLEVVFIATAVTHSFGPYCPTGTSGAILTTTAVSVRELPGNHATQATSTKRPVLKQDAGGHYYLLFDGVDDALATGSIDFTATDKMTVVAGVRKLSDAAYGAVAELSSSYDTNSGVFTAGGGTSGNIVFASKGTISSVAQVVLSAPITRVFTGLGGISTDQSRLRLNGTQYASTTTDQGTGNYGNYPLYIGSRAGTSLPFNGHLYSLIVRGAQSTDAQIVSAETYVNSKTGAY